MSEPTPGPWEVVAYGNPECYEIDGPDESIAHDIWNKADADLIAASPEMRAVCEKLASIEARPDGCCRDEDTGTLWEAIQLSRAILARVKGGI